MGFSKATKREVLVRSARHCCVCHRYKGLKIEVHHIIPRADNGTDDIDNAIALCLDCHADAGHYNPKHPKGTKLGAEELRHARDAWFDSVEQHKISAAPTSDLHARYIFSSDLEILQEVCEAKFENIPINNPLLLETEPLKFLRGLLGPYRCQGQRSVVWGERHQSMDSYFRAHPDATRTMRGRPPFPFFDSIRYPGYQEIKEKVVPEDPISGLLLNLGVPEAEICCAVTFNDGCGGVECHEQFVLRPLACLFLAVENRSSEAVRIDRFAGRQNLDAESYTSFGGQVMEPFELPLSRTSILPGEHLLVPMAVVLLPFNMPEYVVLHKEESSDKPGSWTTKTHLSIEKDRLVGFMYSSLGPVVLPRTIGCENSNDETELHEFDFSRVYRLDKGWACGSCPHLFIFDEDWAFKSSLFEHSQGRSVFNEVAISGGIQRIAIAELEEEISWIDEIVYDGDIIARDVTLKKDQVIFVDVPEGIGTKHLLFKGGYRPDVDGGGFTGESLLRNERIAYKILELDASNQSRGQGTDGNRLAL